MSSDDALMIRYLYEQGLSATEISQVLNKIDEYDVSTADDSVFDSVDNGGLNLKEIISGVNNESSQI